jgi:hypothetical protein
MAEETPVVVPSPDPLPILPQTKEEELAQLVLEFQTRYNATFNFIIDFKPASYMNSGPTTTVVGVCEVYSDGSKKIFMNQDWWPTTNSLMKKVLTFHELGHCYFNRSHDNRTFPTTRPYSIMYPYIDPVAYYFLAFEEYYLNEMENSTALSIPSYPITFKTNADGTCFDE